MLLRFWSSCRLNYRKTFAVIFATTLISSFFIENSAIGAEEQKIAAICFFGYGGLDLARIKANLPIHVGDSFSPQSADAIKETVKAQTGLTPTDIATLTFKNSNFVIYIGLPGNTSHHLTYKAAPTGNDRLPALVEKIYDQEYVALTECLRRGKVGSDVSRGFELSSDPTMRALQLKMRSYALKNEKQLFQVLANASDPHQRALAVHAIGVGRRSKRQIAVLIDATRDSDSSVRNNATRALTILGFTDPSIEQQIPFEQLCEMLNSDSYTDRNKAAGLIETRLKNNDPELLSRLHEQCLDSLCEMAYWDLDCNIDFYRGLLARFAGISKEQLTKMSPSELVAAVRTQKARISLPIRYE